MSNHQPRTLLGIPVLGVIVAAAATLTAVPPSLALDDVACPPPSLTDRAAVPGGDAGLAGFQPGPVPTAEPGRCWFTAIDLNILLPDAVASDRVVAVSDGGGQVVAVAAADGAGSWTYRVAEEGEGQVHGLSAGPDAIYAAGPAGLTALDPADGTRRWRHRVSSDGALLDAAGFFWPTARGDTVYGLAYSTPDDVTWDRRLVALDAATGDLRWEATLGDAMAGAPSSDGAIVVVAPGDGTLLAFSAATGERSWIADTTTLGQVPVTRPAVTADLVMVGLADGSVVALDARTGTTAWRYPGPGGTIASVSVAGSRVLVSDATTLVALDASGGTLVWSAPIQASPPVFPLTSIPGAVEDAVVVGTTDAMDVASVVALDLATGVEFWRVRTDAYGAVMSPLLSGGRIVVPVYDMVGLSGLLSLGVGG